MSGIVLVMGVRNPYVEFLTEQFEPVGEITSRAMFGGYCLYCDGIVFALVAGNAVYLKADDENRSRFEDRGLRRFKPFEDRNETMSYYEAPPEIFEDSDAMKDWIGESVNAGRRRTSRSRPPRARKSKVR
ncbi:MAG TPA: TfoX/Sxy family protein [Bryobacteraceae bacterium]|nr:TfoX/Sxy family protein [Bryobacteraceae bacterium]